MNKVTYLHEVSKQKMKYIRNILNRRENMKNIYVHDLLHEHSQLESYFPNKNIFQTNNNFGHDYIFNCYMNLMLY